MTSNTHYHCCFLSIKKGLMLITYHKSWLGVLLRAPILKIFLTRAPLLGSPPLDDIAQNGIECVYYLLLYRFMFVSFHAHSIQRSNLICWTKKNVSGRKGHSIIIIIEAYLIRFWHYEPCSTRVFQLIVAGLITLHHDIVKKRSSKNIYKKQPPFSFFFVVTEKATLLSPSLKHV